MARTPKMLRTVLGVIWKEHKTNEELYGKLMKVTDSLRVRRLRFIGHYWRNKDELANKVLMLEPKQGTRRRGKPATTYLDQLKKDTEMSSPEISRRLWKTGKNGES